MKLAGTVFYLDSHFPEKKRKKIFFGFCVTNLLYNFI